MGNQCRISRNYLDILTFILFFLGNKLVFGIEDIILPIGCEDLMPIDQTSEPQETEAPFMITPSTTFYKSGDFLTVNISTDAKYESLLLQARTIKTPLPIGLWFDLPEDYKPVNCSGDNDTVLYAGKDAQTENVSFTWNANVSEPFQFIATFIGDQTNYWINVTSTTIYVIHGTKPFNKSGTGKDIVVLNNDTDIAEKKKFNMEGLFTTVLIAGAYVGMYTTFSLLLI